MNLIRGIHRSFAIVSRERTLISDWIEEPNLLKTFVTKLEVEGVFSVTGRGVHYA